MRRYTRQKRATEGGKKYNIMMMMMIIVKRRKGISNRKNKEGNIRGVVLSFLSYFIASREIERKKMTRSDERRMLFKSGAEVDGSERMK